MVISLAGSYLALSSIRLLSDSQIQNTVPALLLGSLPAYTRFLPHLHLDQRAAPQHHCLESWRAFTGEITLHSSDWSMFYKNSK